jgi:hypothetical protein
LVNSFGISTGITLSVVSNDSWNADVDTGTPNGELLDGIIKVKDDNSETGGGVMTFTFNNVPVGLYRLIAYTAENGGEARIDTTVAGTGVTYTTLENASAADFATAGFVRAVSTDPAARDLGNYVQFDNILSTGTITLTATHRGGTDGIGIAGLQLEQVPEPGSIMMLAAGAGLLGMMRRRRA